MQGLTTEEMDPVDVLIPLLKKLHVPPFLRMAYVDGGAGDVDDVDPPAGDGARTSSSERACTMTMSTWRRSSLMTRRTS